jgi:dihydrofolate synthase/folylpolyglutamate synthase
MTEMDHVNSNVASNAGAPGASFKTYREALGWIKGLETFGMKPGLDRMRRLMEKLGHPERRLKFIHVAGTNGKGSTCAYLSSVLRASGYDVGTFTSPYLEKFTNRIQYNSADIPEEDVLRIANQLKPLADELADTELGAPTMFEICTALAIVYFARVTYPDYVVLETGLGGRLDATNVVVPVLSIITNIGRDHMEVLGDTIGAVAAEKAGIIKAGVPVVSAAEQPEAIAVLEKVCADKKCTLYLLGRQFGFEPVSSDFDKQVFDFRGPFRRIPGLKVSLNGHHQLKNAAVAVMALEVLRQYYALIVEDDVLHEALQAARWPGRLEMVSDRPRLLLDGAHNPEGAETLADALKQLYRPKRTHLLVGALANKEHRGLLAPLLPLADTVIVTEPDFRNPMPADKLAEIVRDQLAASGRQSELIVEPDWKRALEQLSRRVGPDELGVVCGSLYLISDVRSWVLRKSPAEKGW